MDSTPTGWIVPAGAIVAALIAGSFSFLNLVLSKEQKLSELRQIWIDGLREDLATHIASTLAIEYLVGVYRHQHGENINYIELSAAINEPNMLGITSFTRIMLRLNHGDRSAAQAALIEELNKMKDFFNAADYGKASGCVPKIREQGQLVLKEEWERVKLGEPTFRWSKRIALIVLLASMALGGTLAFQAWSRPNAGVMGSGSKTTDTTTGAPTTKTP